jgi:hypothetical protein
VEKVYRTAIIEDIPELAHWQRKSGYPVKGYPLI